MADQQQQPVQNQTAAPVQGTTGTATTGGDRDYLDKALDKAEGIFGKKTGHNIDSNQMRGTNEKITDGLRGAFEKATGKKVPEKYSN